MDQFQRLVELVETHSLDFSFKIWKWIFLKFRYKHTYIYHTKLLYLSSPPSRPEVINPISFEALPQFVIISKRVPPQPTMPRTPLAKVKLLPQTNSSPVQPPMPDTLRPQTPSSRALQNRLHLFEPDFLAQINHIFRLLIPEVLISRISQIRVLRTSRRRIRRIREQTLHLMNSHDPHNRLFRRCFRGV